MISIGLTGSLGAGKSTVTRFFRKRGAAVLDADRMVHAILAHDRGVIRKIIKAFGPEILAGQRIDRRKLAGKVFGRPRELKKLTGIVHPAVIRDIRRRIRDIGLRRRRTIVVVDAALLIESGLHRYLDYCVVVNVSRDTQRNRIEKSGVIPWEEARTRIKSQMSPKEKLRYADIVIDNNGGLAATQKQVHEIWRRLKAKV